MPRLTHRLTEQTVRNATAPGVYPDGAGLYLQITKSGSRSWLYRYGLNGRVRYMGLGRCDLVSISQARKAAGAAASLKSRGIDPIDTRHAERAAVAAPEATGPIFEEFAEAYIVGREGSWKNPKHQHQWRQSLRLYAYPVIGKVGVADVSTAQMLQILEPIWMSIPEMASRVRGRIERILASAAVKGLRTAGNVATWNGHLSEALPARKPAMHFSAMPYDELPSFMHELREIKTVGGSALEFLILTASRTGEVLLARWPEISIPDRNWTIPAERMKSGREHVVPLPTRALEVLEFVRPLAGEGDWVFPGMMRGKPLSTNALLFVAQRRLESNYTVHGFRSTFRDWAGDCTEFPREVAEAALAHAVGDRTEAAYRRGSALLKRTALMAAWANYCESVKIENSTERGEHANHRIDA